MEIPFDKVLKDCLRDQFISTDEPGTILQDFQMLLDFLEPDGVEAKGKYNLIPSKYINELDQRLSQPLKLQLKRPQLRSHPYLQGMNLLLRASGLTMVQGSGSKARLVLNPIMMEQWDQLNLTERYFNLLEAWLVLGRDEMIGEKRGFYWRNSLFEVVQTWRYCTSFNHPSPSSARSNHLFFGGIRISFHLALMELFGLLEVESTLSATGAWEPLALHQLLYGDAVLSLLNKFHFTRAREIKIHRPEPDEIDETVEETELDVPRFGVWQDLFQPYFPEWRNNLKFVEPEYREGVFVFKVSLGNVWRKIAIPDDATLDDLVDGILSAFRFDDEHLYEIQYRDPLGAIESVFHPMMDEGPWGDEIAVGALPVELGQQMDLTYDFGDEWKFTITLEAIEPPNARLKGPKVLEKQGKAPEQYRSWD